MTRCWNADEFHEALTEIFRAAGQVRAVLEQSVPQAVKEEHARMDRAKFWLECHARDFIIDHVLSVLNWQLQPSMDAGEYIGANLVTEQSPGGTASGRLREETPEHMRRLDYLGYARDTDRPLLIVEAKRPDLDLPGAPAPLASPEAHPLGASLATVLDALGAGRPVPKRVLTSIWTEALGQVRRYCRSVADVHGSWPARAVVTNGDWLVLFTDPENAFTDSPGTPTRPHAILVFESSDKLLEYHKRLWDQLEYGSLAKIDRRVHVAQVPFVIDPAVIEACSYGLRISYTHKSTNYRKAPLLSVSPLLFVRSAGASFIQVVSDLDQEVPADGRGSVSEHVEQVAVESHSLKRQLEERVLGGRVLPLVSVEAHCEHREAFRVRPLVQALLRSDGQSFLLLTGATPHFVLPTSDYLGCEFHSHAGARARGAAQREGPVLESSIEPKAYFIDGSLHHCTHRDAYGVKREPVTEANSARCGHRGSVVGSAFCEIWRFEEFLCCRTCAFHAVCSQATAFSLPCATLVPLTHRGARL